MLHDVFISYSSKDKDIADKVCATLESHNISCWIAPRDILPGMDWGESILDAITSAKVMVIIFSNNSNISVQVKREVQNAVEEGISILPFRVENVLPTKSMKFFLGTQHWLDAFTLPIEQHLDKLESTTHYLMEKLTRTESPGQSTTNLAEQTGSTVMCQACGNATKPTIISGMKYCSQCGHVLKESVNVTSQSSTTQTNKCSSCGVSTEPSIIDGKAYCNNCGIERVDYLANIQGDTSPTGKPHCNICKNDIEPHIIGTRMYCPICGSEYYSDEIKICNQCGSKQFNTINSISYCNDCGKELAKLPH